MVKTGFRRPTQRLPLPAAALLAIGGCANQGLGGKHTREQTRSEQTVRLGVVEQVRPVKIEDLTASTTLRVNS
jgi:outer membrane lipoprotein SlyB